MAPDGQLQRTGDWSGSHHQQMRAVPLLSQRSPLMDAKTVLLVDDRKCQLIERHALLDQGVRPDDNVGGPILQPCVDLFSLLTSDTTGKLYITAGYGYDFITMKLMDGSPVPLTYNHTKICIFVCSGTPKKVFLLPIIF